jgi:hypothetical protein
MSRLVVVAAAALVLAGCRVDFFEVSSRRESPANLQTSFSLTEGADRWINMSGYLDPGIGDDGAPRSVVNDTLRVGGYVLTPEKTDHDGRRGYWGTWLDPAHDGLDALVHHAPRIEGIAYIPEPVSFGMHRRVGPDVMAMALGDTIALVTTAGDDASPAPEQAHWSLEIGSPPHLLLSRSGTGHVPDTILVPADWLVWARGQPLKARLRISRRWLAEDPDGAYWWTLHVASDMQWTLVWE